MCAIAFISEHTPVFRAPREGDGRSAPVHGRVTIHTSSPTQKIALEGDKQINKQTDIATTRKNLPKGQFFENYKPPSPTLKDTKKSTFWRSCTLRLKTLRQLLDPFKSRDGLIKSPSRTIFRNCWHTFRKRREKKEKNIFISFFLGCNMKSKFVYSWNYFKQTIVHLP